MERGNRFYILHLISSLSRGGRERQLAMLLKYSKSTDVTNKIICFNKTEDSYVDEYEMEKDIFYLTSKNIFKRLRQIKSQIQAQNPDILWTWGGFEASFGVLFSFLLGITHINGSIRHGIVRFNKKQLWRMFVLHLSRYRVANSRAGLKANRLKKGYVLYNGLDEQFFDTDRNAGKVILEEFNISPDNLILISVANLVPYKDYKTVIKALDEIKSEINCKFHYLIVGEGTERSHLEKLINETNLQDNVTITGRRKDVRNLLSSADIYIHSSRGEGCSNAILEAMAAGLPIIATDTGGTSEIVEKGSGICFQFRNVSELKESILMLLNKPDLIKIMGENSRKLAREKYSIEMLFQNYYKILTEIKGQ